MAWLLGLKYGLSDQFEGRVIIPRGKPVSKVLGRILCSGVEKLVEPLCGPQEGRINRIRLGALPLANISAPPAPATDMGSKLFS